MVDSDPSLLRWLGHNPVPELYELVQCVYVFHLRELFLGELLPYFGLALGEFGVVQEHALLLLRGNLLQTGAAQLYYFLVQALLQEDQLGHIEFGQLKGLRITLKPYASYEFKTGRLQDYVFLYQIVRFPEGSELHFVGLLHDIRDYLENYFENRPHLVAILVQAFHQAQRQRIG